MDALFERISRRVAQRSSRRSFLAVVGKAILAGVALPLLPVNRVRGTAEAVAPLGKAAGAFSARAVAQDTECDYWRYCGFDGYLCTCCGGEIHACPAGTAASPSAWVGTCRHPSENKEYIISYRDCCGKDGCGRCACQNNEGQMPIYRPELNNDTVWCFGAESMVYHCTTATVLGAKS